ncbi:hypothetical protein Ddc_01685 [Ditylenchus destructor]|nr:hypothetical protein Ddc_01685 [Ditylenchus destructor]
MGIFKGRFPLRKRQSKYESYPGSSRVSRGSSFLLSVAGSTITEDGGASTASSSLSNSTRAGSLSPSYTCSSRRSTAGSTTLSVGTARHRRRSNYPNRRRQRHNEQDFRLLSPYHSRELVWYFH